MWVGTSCNNVSREARWIAAADGRSAAIAAAEIHSLPFVPRGKWNVQYCIELPGQAKGISS